MPSSSGLTGSLYTYDAAHRLVAFESPSSTSSTALIFVGGLGDGFNAIPVLQPLSQALSTLNEELSLIQVLTRSSYDGWGSGDVDRDAEDLYALEKYLREKAGKKGKLVLMGHSTGCQDIVRFFQLYPQSTYTAAILQAPVSDREHAESQTPAAVLSYSLKVASEMVQQGKGHHLLPPEIVEKVYPTGEGEAPRAVKASRWMSLAAKGGKEDYFSSDLSDDELEDIFKPFKELRKQLCIFLGDKDEAYPKGLDIELLLSRFEKARGVARTEKSHSAVLMDANHAIDGEVAMKEFIDRTLAFLGQL